MGPPRGSLSHSLDSFGASDPMSAQELVQIIGGRTASTEVEASLDELKLFPKSVS